MKLTEILNNGKFTLSFEVFPPKTWDSFKSVKEATEQIAKIKPSFISVTYGAGGGIGDYTVDIAENIEKNYNIPTLAHLTCVSSNKEIIAKKTERIKNAGIENILALRGDLTSEILEKRKNKLNGYDYNHATDLIKELKQKGDFCIGGACYPEVHPESGNSKEDICYLKKKTEAGCEFFITQMFFDNNLLYNFLYKLREAGITVPVVAGIMPITSAKQVERAVKLSGSFMPQRFKNLVDRFGHNDLAMKQAGIAYATDQIIDLYANGIENVHVYSMNKPEVAQSIKNNLSHIIEND